MKRLSFSVLFLAACGAGSTSAPPTSVDAGADAAAAEVAAEDLPTPPADLGLEEVAPPPDVAAEDVPDVPDVPAPPSSSESVLQHHKNATRDGLYVAPTFTHAAAAGLALDASFSAKLEGPVYAQPLYVEGTPDLVVVVTERDVVWAFDAATGAVAWKSQVGDPVPLDALPCGNIDPLGITSTPVADLESRRLYLDAMTTPDGGKTKQHLVFALSLNDGAVAPGWPVDVSALAKDNGHGFDSEVQNQRGALLLRSGVVYVPYGGHWGDCGEYNGWLIGVPVDDPAHPVAWAARATGGATWAPSGVAADDTGIFITTGNTFGATTWSDGEAIIRFDEGPVFSQEPKDYWAPTNWKTLDNQDLDIGGSGPVLFDVPGATPSKLTIALGKDGKAYLLDRTNLGGVSKALATLQAADDTIIGAAATYRTALGTYVVFKGVGAGCPGGEGAGLVALRVGAAAPPTLSVAWCAEVDTLGSPMVTTTDGTTDPIVWVAGAEGDKKLHGFDGDTGEVVYTQTGAMGSIKRYTTPIVAKGRLFVGGNDAVYAFKPL